MSWRVGIVSKILLSSCDNRLRFFDKLLLSNLPAGDLYDFSETRAYTFYICGMILPHGCIFMCCCFSGILWRAGIGETENDRLSVSM